MAHFICQLGCLLAAIFQTDSLQTATQEVTADTLCVFDVEMVLIQPADPAFQPANIKKHKFGHLIAGLSESQRVKLIHMISSAGASTLIEADAPCLVRRLTDRGIPLVAITNTMTKEPFESGQIEKLRKLGFVFCPLCEGRVELTNLPKIHGTYPSYHAGVLFANDISKSAVLLDFLSQMEPRPKQVLFIDDKMANLEEVERALSKSEIDFQGYLYTAAKSYPSEEITQQEFDASWQKLINSID